MKKYRSHKVVEAAKVLAVTKGQSVCGLPMEGYEASVPHMVTHSWIERHSDHGKVELVGGYFVRYEDGYTSWSPAQAFEAGYTEIEEPKS